MSNCYTGFAQCAACCSQQRKKQPGISGYLSLLAHKYVAQHSPHINLTAANLSIPAVNNMSRWVCFRHNLGVCHLTGNSKQPKGSCHLSPRTWLSNAAPHKF